MENSKLLKVKSLIEGYTTNAIIDVVTNKKLGKNLLMVNLSGTHSTILIYDGDKGLSEIGTIRYAIRGDSVFISEFEVEESFQGAGIGRTMFEFALAHADAMGATYAYGYAKPTNAVKGVSKLGEDNFIAEQQAIMEVYKRLGCSFDNPKNEGTIDKMFEQKWQPTQKYQKLDKNMLPILTKVVEATKNESLSKGK